MTDVADIHADIEALKEFAGALTRYRHAQREVADRGDYQIAATRASLEEKASQWRSLLARRQADLAACQRAAVTDGESGGHADCHAEADAVREAEERLEPVPEPARRGPAADRASPAGHHRRPRGRAGRPGGAVLTGSRKGTR